MVFGARKASRKIRRKKMEEVFVKDRGLPAGPAARGAVLRVRRIGPGRVDFQSVWVGMGWVAERSSMEAMPVRMRAAPRRERVLRCSWRTRKEVRKAKTGSRVRRMAV